MANTFELRGNYIAVQLDAEHRLPYAYNEGDCLIKIRKILKDIGLGESTIINMKFGGNTDYWKINNSFYRLSGEGHEQQIIIERIYFDPTNPLFS